MKKKTIITTAIAVFSVLFITPAFAQVSMDAIIPDVEEIHTLIKDKNKDSRQKTDNKTADISGVKEVKPLVKETNITETENQIVINIEELLAQFENNLDVNLIPNISKQQMVPFLNVAVNKRDIEVVKEILDRGVDLQGSDDLYYQDPLLIALSNKCDTELALDTDKEIMKLLVENGADMTKTYLKPYQQYDFGVVAEYLHRFKDPYQISYIEKNDKYNVITVATGYIAKNNNPQYTEKFNYLLKLGAKNGAVNKIDIRAFATIMSQYHKNGKGMIDLLLSNDMIIKEDHIKVVKNLTIQRQKRNRYPTAGISIRKLPYSSDKIKKICKNTSYPDIIQMWLPELQKVEKEEELIARLEQKMVKQQEEFVKKIENAVMQINLDKLDLYQFD